MNTTDTTLIQLMNDGFNSIRNDVNAEIKSIKSDVNNELKPIKDDVSAINKELTEIKVKMSSVNKQIYGNGKKGLVDRVNDIENTVSSGGLIWRSVISFIAWIVATGIAIFAALNK